jgi:predicted cupin superfamily sugar epimerase
MHPDAQELIDRLEMLPLPREGGWFRQSWRSTAVLPAGTVPGYASDKPAGTAILALFCDDPAGFSALHRLPTTEVWHFCGGDAFELLLLRPDGSSEPRLLGPDPIGGHEVQVVVPPETWIGGRVIPGGRFALLGCTMAPGFTPEDLVAGGRSELTAAYPDRADQIAYLTRDGGGD